MSREEGLYVGDETLTAEHARLKRLHEGLRPGGNPGRYLATMLGAILGRKAPGLTNQHPQVAAFAKAILRWRSCSHETHTLSRRRGLNPGLVIRDHLGLAVEFISDKRLKALKADDSFAAAYLEELQKEKLV